MSEKTNPSLQKKTAARCAAVQGIYQAAMSEETLDPVRQTDRLKKQLENNAGEQKLLIGMAIEPNYKLVESLLTGVAEHLGDIDAMLDASLTGSWTRARLSPLVAALLQCAIFELSFGKDISPHIVIDEYTRLARRFFEEMEVNFVHGVLSNLSQTSHA